LNKNKEYKDHIEYKILTMTHGMSLNCNVDIFSKIKNLKKTIKKYKKS